MTQAKFSPMFPVFNGFAPNPDDGPRVIAFDADFSASVTRIQKNFEVEQTTGKLGFVQSIWVNNQDNTQELRITNTVTGQTIVFDAGASGADPVFCPNPASFIFESTGQVTVKVFLINIPIASYRSGPITVNTTTQPIIRGTYTDFSSTIAAAGVSQAAIPANPTRLQILLGNPSGAPDSLWYNFTDPAQVGVDSLEIVPGQTVIINTAISTEEIQIYGSVMGMEYIAKELV